MRGTDGFVTIVASHVKAFSRLCYGVAGNEQREAICSAVARIIREERMKRGLSLNVLAERAGLSRQMVSYVEQEERNPSLDTLLRIADVIETPLERIIQRARAEVSPRKTG